MENENLLPKISGAYVIVISLILFLIIMTFFILFDGKFPSFYEKPSKSDQEITKNVFIILFFSLLVFGISVIFIPNLREFKGLFLQISNVTYVILYTIFTILFYISMSKTLLDNYYYIINPIIGVFGIYAFAKAIASNYVEKFNINYEQIKMLIILFCFITLCITIYNVNPGNAVSKYFGYTMLLSIILSVFAFLYILILLSLSDKTANLMNVFSSFGTYGTITFFIFLVLITTILVTMRHKFSDNIQKMGSLVLMVLIIFILWSLLLGANLFSGFSNPLNDVNLYKKSLLMLFGLVISSLIIYWITYNVEKLSSKSSIVSFVLNLILVVLVLGLIYKIMNVQMPIGNTQKNAFFNLIISVALYIPCLVGGMFDGLGKMMSGQQNATNIGSFLMLIAALGVFILYFKMPSVFNIINVQGGDQLVNKPISTDQQYNLGSYQDLNKSEEYDYEYAISFWIFLNAMPPNTNQNYKKYTSLMNYGDKPNIMYKADSNSFMITMQQKDLNIRGDNKIIDFDDNGNRIIYKNDNFLLQKWNNVIINYSGGIMDVFLNGELVKSSTGVVPYHTNDNLTVGQENGIKGGICNVVYFRKPLTKSNIYYLYNLVKDRTPPVLNDSNETITKKDVNKLSSSSKTVTSKIDIQ